MKIDQKNEKQRKRLGAFLLSLRKELGMTLKEAAKKAELSLGYLSQIERGDRVPSRDVIANLARGYGIEEQLILQEAGFLVKPTMDVSPARIDWAFNTVSRDCDYHYGLQVLMEPLGLPTKALLVEIYQEATGRHLLTGLEEGSVQKFLHPEPHLTPELEAQARDNFWSSVQFSHERCPQYPEADVAKSVLLFLIHHYMENWGAKVETVPGLDPDGWTVETIEVDLSEPDDKKKPEIANT